MLRVLQDAGLDVMSSCEEGTCGTCKVQLCSGTVRRKGVALAEQNKERCMSSCVDRGVGKIIIALSSGLASYVGSMNNNIPLNTSRLLCAWSAKSAGGRRCRRCQA